MDSFARKLARAVDLHLDTEISTLARRVPHADAMAAVGKSDQVTVGALPMTERTNEATITFRRPFTLASVGTPQPAGTYRLVTDEEEVLGLSFLAFRRTATMLHLPVISARNGFEQVFRVEPAEIKAALEMDARD